MIIATGSIVARADSVDELVALSLEVDRGAQGDVSNDATALVPDVVDHNDF